MADRLANRWNSTSAGLRSPDEGLETTALLLEDPELAQFLRRRCDVVTDLLRSAADAAHGHGARLATAGPIWARPLAYGWLEGLLPARTTQVVDRLYLLAYHDQVPGVARDVDVAVGAGAPENYAMVQTLWPDQHGGSADVLAAKVRVALDAGITSIGLYNFATAPAPALQWIPAIAELVHATAQSGEATRT